jgi:hypothetical protein
MKKIIINLVILFFGKSLRTKYYNFREKLKFIFFIVKNVLIVYFFIFIKRRKIVVIAHDLYASPATIGDFLFNYFFARFFSLMNYEVHFVIINKEYRNDWNLDVKQKKLYIKTIINVAKILSNKNNLKLFLLDWDTFKSRYLNSTFYFIPLKNDVVNRNRIYVKLFNLLNYLIFFKSKKFRNIFTIDKHFFNSTILDKILFKKTIISNGEYIAWNCRNDIHDIESGRNINIDDFINIYHTLKKYYNQHEILIISDDNGCELIKKWNKSLNFNLKYSKDFSIDYLGDLYLVLNSKFYFQYRGGGMGASILFSKIPYLMVSFLGGYKLFSKYRLTSWALTSQLFFNTNKIAKPFTNSYFIKYNTF